MLADGTWDGIMEHLPETLFVVFVFGGWVMYGIAKAFTDNWRKVREAEQAAALKQSMVEKGMSAADIERVLKAGGPTA